MNGHASESSRYTFNSTNQAQHRAPTLQQSGNLQAIFKSGKIVIGTSLSYPSRHVAKSVAVTGADWCWIDAEHVAWAPDMLIECIQIIIHESAGKMIPVVRVPSKTVFDHMVGSRPRVQITAHSIIFGLVFGCGCRRDYCASPRDCGRNEGSHRRLPFPVRASRNLLCYPPEIDCEQSYRSPVVPTVLIYTGSY
ncbi:hypothetical protein B0H13DRAFT_1959258 [Mycena leptocephala]|nr:hypothetical protein B0H13DRAFT_1959258 [Mycena leptocephala]